MSWRMIPAAALAVTIALLTWLLVQSGLVNTPNYRRALAAFDSFENGQAWLARDALRARAGLLREYDALVRDTAQMGAAVEELRAVGEGPAAGTLATLLRQQEQLSESFKSDNALLQNSLRSFDLLITTIEAQAQRPEVHASLNLLTKAMLHLTLNTADGAAAVVRSQIDELAGRRDAMPDPGTLNQLLAHSRLLTRLLPSVDATVRQIQRNADAPQLLEARTALMEREAAALELAGHYRIGLYAASLALLAVLAHFVVRLRTSTLSLRRRATLELVIAQVSTRLIGSTADDAPREIEDGLRALARCVEMDRAFIVLRAPGDASPGFFSWSDPDRPISPTRRDRLPALCAMPGEDAAFLYVPRVAAMAAGPMQRALSAAGVRAWLRLAMPASSAGTGFLVFEKDSVGLWPSDELFLLQLAADAFAGLLGRQSLEFHRAMLESRVQQARRMEAVGALASGIAHNFNNIVGAISGYAEMAEMQLSATSRAAAHVGEITRAAGRARDLIGRILAFGNPRLVRRHPFDARALFEETASLFRASLPAGGTLHTEVAPGRIVVNGDAPQLQQVLLNLCANALHAMDDRGEVTMRMEMARTRGVRLARGTLRPGAYLRVSVSDTGHGMDAATIRRIFEPFFTTRAAGTGLGLATALEIVREHGGGIGVQSTPGQGTRFDVWLPASAVEDGPAAEPARPTLSAEVPTVAADLAVAGAPPEDGQPAAAPRRASPLNSPRHFPRNSSLAPLPDEATGTSDVVLLLNPDTERRLHEEEVLAALGYEPVGFSSVAEACAACRAAPDRFDVLAVNYDSLDRDGVMRDLAALHLAAPAVPLLIAAHWPTDLQPQVLSGAGVREVVGLPLRSAEIAAALGRCLARRPMPVSPDGHPAANRIAGTSVN